MLVALPVLNDNYIWLYGRENLPVIVIDPAESRPVIDYLQQHQLALEAILLTHNHDDHVAGVKALRQQYPQVEVFGPSETAEYASKIINEGKFHTAHYQIEVIPSGGHTANHVSFLLDGHLFCGDTIFSAGCGRVFTGDYAQMFASLQRLNQLPAETILCPAHEYTLSNLAFAYHVAQDQQHKSAVQNQKILVEKWRAEGKPSLPTTLKREREINPFLQAKDLAEFIQLRQGKDNF